MGGGVNAAKVAGKNLPNDGKCKQFSRVMATIDSYQIVKTPTHPSTQWVGVEKTLFWGYIKISMHACAEKIRDLYKKVLGNELFG